MIFTSSINRIVACTVSILVATSVTASAQNGPDAGARRQQIASLREVCSADFARLCNGVQPGGGRIKACIKSHQSELSDGCRKALSHAKQSK